MVVPEPVLFVLKRGSAGFSSKATEAVKRCST
jgi:hypothetical protein